MSIAYVNVYSVERQYGGPEEGGWWYDTGDVVESHPIAGDEVLAEALRTVLEVMHYPLTQNRYSVLGGEDFRVLIEDEPAAAWPLEQPHYC